MEGLGGLRCRSVSVRLGGLFEEGVWGFWLLFLSLVLCRGWEYMGDPSRMKESGPLPPFLPSLPSPSPSSALKRTHPRTDRMILPSKSRIPGIIMKIIILLPYTSNPEGSFRWI